MLRRTLVCVAVCLTSAMLAASGPSQAARDVPKGTAAPAARAAKFQLTVDSIMRGPKLVGEAPTGLRWSPDGREVFFEWRRPEDQEAATWVVSREGGTPRKLTDEERKNATPARGAWNRAHTLILLAEQGDIVVFDPVTKTRQVLTRTAAAETSPRWARNETAVTFIRDGSLFIVPLAGGTLEQLTDGQPRRPQPPARETESQTFVKAEEEKLIAYTREQAERRNKEEERRKKETVTYPAFDVTPPRQSVADQVLSPDDERVFGMVMERAEGAKPTVVPNYVTQSSYVEDIASRTLVGDVQGQRKVAILNLKTGKTVWPDAAFAGKQKGRTPAREAKEAKAAREIDREIDWSVPQVSADGRYVVAWVQAADNKDRWIVAVDPDTGKTRVLDWLHDEAWINQSGTGGFLPDNRTLYFTSEADGWAHLYTIDVAQEGAKARQLTSGPFEVSGVSLAPDKTRFYLVTSETHPGERHMYSMALDGGSRTRITSMTGSNIGEVSPDGGMIALVHSYSNKPPELYLMPNRPGASATQVTTTPTEEWRSFRWVDPQVLTYKARDGANVYARLYTPEMVGARRDPSRPGVIFVHGAGYTQNAHKYWPSYYREYMFHHLLASRGYVVLDADYRASSGYGRDWRTAIYRHMGGTDLDDIVDGAKFLIASQKVDPKRIGLYGGSYGGFITLMAMFTAADTFAAGAALRPVTDWAHYNHGYTSDILNQPQDDAEAYRRSSPIYFAEGLKGVLLICHGLVDTNVHVQDSMRLAQRLIELRKHNWELAVYPVENHAFEQETSWADEYTRILKLFDTHLRRQPAKVQP